MARINAESRRLRASPDVVKAIALAEAAEGALNALLYGPVVNEHKVLVNDKTRD